MAVPQYTTPTFTLTFDDPVLDLTVADHVYVTFQCGQYKLTKTGDDLTVAAKQIDVWLSQEETGSFIPGNVNIQVNWTDGAGNRAASDIVTCDISQQLLQAVVE